MSAEYKVENKTERAKVIPTVYLLLIRDNKILLLQKVNTGFEDGNFSLPAGHKEAGEYPGEAMIRSAKEEIGITIDLLDLVYVHTMMRMKAVDGERMDQFFMAEDYEGEPKNLKPEKCLKLAWYPINNLPENTIPFVKAAIQLSLAGQTYSEWKKLR